MKSLGINPNYARDVGHFCFPKRQRIVSRSSNGKRAKFGSGHVFSSQEVLVSYILLKEEAGEKVLDFSFSKEVLKLWYISIPGISVISSISGYVEIPQIRCMILNKAEVQSHRIFFRTFLYVK